MPVAVHVKVNRGHRSLFSGNQRTLNIENVCIIGVTHRWLLDKRNGCWVGGAHRPLFSRRGLCPLFPTRACTPGRTSLGVWFGPDCLILTCFEHTGSGGALYVDVQSGRSGVCPAQRRQQERGVPARQADRPASDAGAVERRPRRRRVASAGRVLGVDVPRGASVGRLGAARQRRPAGRLQRRTGEVHQWPS